MKTVTTELLAKLLRQLVRELRTVGFIVNSLSCDGASENRRLARELCDVAARDLIDPHLLFEAAEAAVRAARARLPFVRYETEEAWAIAEDQLLSEATVIAVALGDVKIGWTQTSTPDQDVIVFIRDAPHCLKKLCNSFEKRDGMLLDGQTVSLGVLHDVFKATHYTKTGEDPLKDSKLTEAHFSKNNLSRMNVKLAVQIFSKTMYDLCTVTLPTMRPEVYARLAPMLGPTLQLLQDWNHVMDVMNSLCHLPHLSIDNINEPNHRHVKELLQTSAGMERWRQQSSAGCGGARPTQWVSSETGKDCIALGVGVAALAALHARCDRCLILRRLDQDKCEHHFANVRERGAHGAVTVAVAKSAEMRSQTQRLATAVKGNARGSPADKVLAGKMFDPRQHMPTSEDIVRDSLPLMH